MPRCPICSAEVPAASRFCNSCGTALGEAATVTLAPTRPPSSSQSSSEEGRFPANTVLGERYRILGLLGRGGMGEVYRAFDLKLDQTVALKFLPAATANNPRLLERFRGEVRIARQVSHRNVCRVHDIGEADGSAFISMEYVDGEDLGSLLNKIGRLPPDKAIEIARKLCAGLAAAHEKGVLHRDLKPANIMLDSRGHVLIMDFGLAAAADAIAGGDIRSGTPAYMAPEQKEGREVTVRSDIYSLGMVLHEIVTGKRPGSSSASMSKDVDPAMEKVIQRCLDPNPRNRPATALDVARALPGGDPLAEALAAGDTPSPAMVAASDDTGVLSVRAAVACLAIVVVGLAAIIFWGSRNEVVNLTPTPFSPEVLTQKAREIAVRLGYTDPPADQTHSLGYEPYLNWARENLKPEEFRAQLAEGRPAPLTFLYSQSPRYIAPRDTQVTLDDPPRIPGWLDMKLDPQGRLTYFRAFPHPRMPAAFLGPMDWSTLFEAAALDPSLWTPVDSQEVPLTAFDQHAAWRGFYPNAPYLPLRIEAASWRGRLVYFELFGPWPPSSPSLLLQGLLFVLGFMALLLGLRNVRSGRGDLRGALRLGAFVLVCTFLNAMLLVHHTPAADEFPILLEKVTRALLLAAFVWALYMAIEPYVRRNWPQALIGWTRMLAGNVRDPLVAGHILAGIAVGIVIQLLQFETRRLTGIPSTAVLLWIESAGSIAQWFGGLSIPPAIALVLFFVFLLLRLVLRRTWLTAAVALALVAVSGFDSPSLAISVPFQLVAGAIVLLTSIRFGMLALTVTIIFVAAHPFTSDFSSWFALQGWIYAALVLALALWCFSNALGGRKVWKGDILEG